MFLLSGSQLVENGVIPIRRVSHTRLTPNRRIFGWLYSRLLYVKCIRNEWIRRGILPPTSIALFLSLSCTVDTVVVTVAQFNTRFKGLRQSPWHIVYFTHNNKKNHMKHCARCTLRHDASWLSWSYVTWFPDTFPHWYRDNDIRQKKTVLNSHIKLAVCRACTSCINTSFCYIAKSVKPLGAQTVGINTFTDGVRIASWMLSE